MTPLDIDNKVTSVSENAVERTDRIAPNLDRPNLV
jgi:hypothetical protein